MKKMWAVYALFSAVFASLTALFAKVGITGINSTLATAVRTVFVLIMAWGMVAITGHGQGLRELSVKSWCFLALSGIATGASWLCYYKAMQTGPVTSVVTIDKFSLVLTMLLAAVFLGEAFNWKTALGAGLIMAGTLLVAFAK